MDNYMNVEQFIKNCEEREVQLKKTIETTKQSIQKLDEMNKDNKRRIYSMNTAAYLIGVEGRDYTKHKDEDKPGLKYFCFEDDCSDAIAEFKADYRFQRFIRAYAELRKEIRG